jgi:hypothetical protein
LFPFLLNLYSKYLAKEGPEGFGDLKIGKQVIQTVKYAHVLVPQAKAEKRRQGMTAD